MPHKFYKKNFLRELNVSNINSLCLICGRTKFKGRVMTHGGLEFETFGFEHWYIFSLKVASWWARSLEPKTFNSSINHFTTKPTHIHYYVCFYFLLWLCVWYNYNNSYHILSSRYFFYMRLLLTSRFLVLAHVIFPIFLISLLFKNISFVFTWKYIHGPIQHNPDKFFL